MSLARLTWLSVLVPVLSCASNRQPDILPDLVAHKPVCLALDWGSGDRAAFYGGSAPDTLLLFQGRREPFADVDSADAWGPIELAPSQQARAGGGWRWWLMGDPLNIRADNPTMDGIAIQSVRPDVNSTAVWRVFGLGPSDTGRVVLLPYKCGA